VALVTIGIETIAHRFWGPPSMIRMAFATLATAALLLSGCVGASTPPDPDRHPDAAKRKEMRHFYDNKHRRVLRRSD
jgi:hypothetical protein